MARYFFEIAHKGQVVFGCSLTAETEGEALGIGWDAFDPGGRIVRIDAMHHAWVETL